MIWKFQKLVGMYYQDLLEVHLEVLDKFHALTHSVTSARQRPIQSISTVK